MICSGDPNDDEKDGRGKDVETEPPATATRGKAREARHGTRYSCLVGACLMDLIPDVNNQSGVDAAL
jgi:hypothetical protein